MQRAIRDSCCRLRLWYQDVAPAPRYSLHDVGASAAELFEQFGAPMLSSSQTSAPVRGQSIVPGDVATASDTTLTARLNAAASYDKLNDMMHSHKRQAELRHIGCGRRINDGDSATLKGVAGALEPVSQASPFSDTEA